MGVWGFFRGVVAEGGNLSTIPLLGLICRNDLSREELQQLLHSTLHPACDRRGAAQQGIQVPNLMVQVQTWPGQHNLHLSLFGISDIDYMRSGPWGGIGWVLALPGTCNH